MVERNTDSEQSLIFLKDSGSRVSCEHGEAARLETRVMKRYFWRDIRGSMVISII